MKAHTVLFGLVLALFNSSHALAIESDVFICFNEDESMDTIELEIAGGGEYFVDGERAVAPYTEVRLNRDGFYEITRRTSFDAEITYSCTIASE